MSDTLNMDIALPLLGDRHIQINIGGRMIGGCNPQIKGVIAFGNRCGGRNRNTDLPGFRRWPGCPDSAAVFR